MKLLLDTQVFLWLILEPGRLPRKSMDLLQDPAKEVVLSAVSLWEISIKSRLGKLTLHNLSVNDMIPSAKKMGITLISLTPEEAVTQGKLGEDTHFDPFDRMLIWQAIQRDMVLISSDSQFERFAGDGLKLLWK